MERLLSAHPDLQRLFLEVIKRYDCTVLEGIRTMERQRELVRTGKSKTLASKHLKGWAVDVVPYPIDWSAQGQERMRHFAGFVFGVAAGIGMIDRLRWGGDWDGDAMTRGDGLRDQSFMDLPHFELTGVEDE
tara:strand:+ start:13753 stop:14148 length:396 start_codon:yes stop_codon:yes gene_type:complete